ncbi:MAG: hypothetical protein ACRDWI_03960 [Jiangellaceae bacterium]
MRELIVTENNVTDDTTGVTDYLNHVSKYVVPRLQLDEARVVGADVTLLRYRLT